MSVLVIQKSRVQFRPDGVYYIYLSKRYNEIWRRLKERKVFVKVRIEIPGEVLEEEKEG